VAKQVAEAFEFTYVSHGIGRKKRRPDTMQVERHSFDQAVVIPT
jgi:hypothetical protein